MAKHLESGNFGESLARIKLLDEGYKIIAQNWRYKHLEIDIVAMDSDVLVFVEVKSRYAVDFGDPADFVDCKKQQKLIKAADAYLETNSYIGDIRFDIVSVYLTTQKIEIIKDAFWSD